MKKLFLILVAAAVFISALGLHVNSAKAEGYIEYVRVEFIVGTGIVYTFSGEGFRNRDLKGSSIWVGSDFHDLYCWARKEAGEIVCVASGGLTQFAGQIGVVYLGGQVFWVPIPNKHGAVGAGSAPLTCDEGQVLGAEYMVDFGSGSDGPYFVPGDTLDEADELADLWFGQSDDYFRLNGAVCGEEPS